MDHPGDDHQVQYHAQSEAEHIAHRCPGDADGGHGYQVVVGDDLHYAPQCHDDHGQIDEAMGLEDRVAHQHQADEDARNAEH